MRAKSQSKTVIVQWTAQRNTWVRGWKGKGELSKISSFVVSDHTIFYNNRAAILASTKACCEAARSGCTREKGSRKGKVEMPFRLFERMEARKVVSGLSKSFWSIS